MKRVILAAAFVLFPLTVMAQDPVKVSPELYKVVIDNASVRALDVHIPAGAKSPMHSHPASVISAFTACKIKFTSSDGKTREAEFKPGDAVWRDAETHAAENVGSAECHALQIELKTASKKAK